MVEHRAFSRSSGFFLASNSGSRSNAPLIRSARSRAARSRAFCRRRLLAAGSSSSSARRAWTWAWASANASSRVGRRRNDAAPALARTRIPSWATRFRSTSPSASEHRDALGQQSVQQLAMSGAEVGQGVVIDRDIAADPLIGGMVPAELIELPGTADAIDGGVEPQGHEDLGIDGRSARSAVDGLDGSVQGAEVQFLDIIPDRASGMVGREQVVEGRGSEDDLLAVGGAESRLAASAGGSASGGGPCVIGRRLEERGLFGTGQVGDRLECSWRHCSR